MAAGGGITSIRGDILQPKHGKIYYYSRVEALVFCWCICTFQKTAHGDLGRESPGTMTGTNRDLPHGRSKTPDQDTAGLTQGGTDDHHRIT